MTNRDQKTDGVADLVVLILVVVEWRRVVPTAPPVCVLGSESGERGGAGPRHAPLATYLTNGEGVRQREVLAHALASRESHAAQRPSGGARRSERGR